MSMDLNTTAFRPPTVSGVRKAMTILNVLDEPLLGRILQHFDHEDLARINSVEEELEPVPSEELTGLIEEFAHHFARRLEMLGDRRKPIGILEKVFTPEELAKLVAPDEEKQEKPVWTDDRFSSRGVLEPLVKEEHPQTAAFLLSRIDSDLSADLFETLDHDRRNDILLRMLEMRPVQPRTVAVVEEHIRVTYIENSDAEKSAKARARIAGIVNRMDKKNAEIFLKVLHDEKPEEAQELKKLLFAFEDIPKLSDKSRLVLFDRVPTELNIRALNVRIPN